MRKRKIEPVQNDVVRVVAHIDLDCFYVQVERSINPDLKNKPVGVVQYNPFGDLKTQAPTDNRTTKTGGLIAVSYEARAKGVKRIMKGAEAIVVKFFALRLILQLNKVFKACPDLILVQVPVSHGKADLKIYRDASTKIVSVLGTRYPNSILERASIDEVYLDITSDAHKMLETFNEQFLESSIQSLVAVPTLIAGEDSKEMNLSRSQLSKGHNGQNSTSNVINVDSFAQDGNTTSHSLSDNTTSASVRHSWFCRSLSQWSENDKLLLCGSLIIRNLRQDVYEQLGFTCSGGVAHNKMLAKLASAMHKPNKQTVVPESVLSSLMKSLPLSRIQGLGGKLGRAVNEEFGERIQTMGDILTTDRALLVDRFGEESTQWMIDAARGIDRDPVQDRALAISIGCSKTFRSTHKLTPENVVDGVVQKWYCELAHELVSRVEKDTADNGRVPRSMHVGLSVVPHDDAMEKQREKQKISDRSFNAYSETGFSVIKTVPMIVTGGAEAIGKTAVAIAARALSEHPKMVTPSYIGNKYRITGISLGANNFEAVESGAKAITSYFNIGTGYGGSNGDEEVSMTSARMDPFAQISPFIGNVSAVSSSCMNINGDTGNKKASIASFFTDKENSTGNRHNSLFESRAISVFPQHLHAPAKSTKTGISGFFKNNGSCGKDNSTSVDLTCDQTLDDDLQWGRVSDADDSNDILLADNSSNDINGVIITTSPRRVHAPQSVSHTSHNIHPSSNSHVQPLSMADLDPSVFSELPADIQEELRRSLVGGGGSGAGMHNSERKTTAVGSKKSTSGNTSKVNSNSKQQMKSVGSNVIQRYYGASNKS